MPIARPDSNGRLTEAIQRVNGRSDTPPPEENRNEKNGKHQTLIESIQDDIASLGVVGEVDAALLIYLAGTSRLLPEPLRLINRGSSSSGKSYRQSKVVEMFPPDSVVEATNITPQALYYLPPGSLRNKFLVKGERSFSSDESGKDATAALRQLISENKIIKQVTVRGGEDGFETKTIIQDGPVSFTETTTQTSIFVEDLNRCLQVYSNESSEQTKRIKSGYAERYLPDAQSPDKTAILDRHHEFQASLRYLDVRIPYALALMELMPNDKLEMRRVGKQLLSCIEVITLLHQLERLPTKQGYLLATLGDYEIARRLLFRSLSQSVGSVAQKYADLLRTKFPSGEFTSTQTIEAGCFETKPTRDKWLNELSEKGVLRLVSKAKGNQPARYTWTTKSFKSVLPTVKELRDSVKA